MAKRISKLVMVVGLILFIVPFSLSSQENADKKEKEKVEEELRRSIIG